MGTRGVADLTGRVLVGRYRLAAPLGTGASGRVYAAWDIRLQRRVAVKVLHAALADDAGFLRRFGAEAQLAASLHHPNVVAVYDWGGDGSPFMVLELLEGGSLRSLLDRGDRLSPAQAAAVGGQIAAGLHYAHARGLVHRDVKPANLLFDEHGTPRLADFGLARALAEASWTEPAGAVLGTARYAAPEQVRGLVDARSDVYSLALVLLEATTGAVPFAAETSLATLLARVERHLEAPPELGCLAPVLERAGRADPAGRFPDARAFAGALAEAAASLGAPGEIPLPGPVRIDFDPHPTEIGPGPTSPAPAPAPATGPEPSQPERGRRSRRLVPVVVLAVLAVAAGAVTFAVAGVTGPQVRVPNFVGSSERRASEAAEKALVKLRIRKVGSDDPAGTVVGQDPAAGTLVFARQSVILRLSEGPAPVGVPPVNGQAEAAARAVLDSAGFVVTTEHRTDEDVPRGHVVARQPSAGETTPGSEIHLVISDGPNPVEVPNIVGKSYDDAAKALTAKRFKVTREDEYSDTVPAGHVIRTDPVANAEAPRDSAVGVVVSLGPDLVTVGDYGGETVEDAVTALEQAGLQVDVVDYRSRRRVKHQDPPAGTRVRRNARVTLYL